MFYYNTNLECKLYTFYFIYHTLYSKTRTILGSGIIYFKYTVIHSYTYYLLRILTCNNNVYLYNT